MTGRGVPLIMLRHGPTDWNAEGRIQGRCDRPLSDAGRAAVRRWRLPEACKDAHWVTSPLVRARETVALLGHGDAASDPALVEMHWGPWEGCRLAQLRDRYGSEMIEMEARGLDFRPPGGESPRDVQRRLEPWLAEVGAGRRPCVAVSHKGVIRALLSLASGWDMTAAAPEKLLNDCAQGFLVDQHGAPSVDRLNLPLLP